MDFCSCYCNKSFCFAGSDDVPHVVFPTYPSLFPPGCLYLGQTFPVRRLYFFFFFLVSKVCLPQFCAGWTQRSFSIQLGNFSVISAATSQQQQQKLHRHDHQFTTYIQEEEEEEGNLLTASVVEGYYLVRPPYIYGNIIASSAFVGSSFLAKF